MPEPTKPPAPTSAGHDNVTVNTAPSLGLSGTFAMVANFSAVVIIAGLLVWFLTVFMPAEHDRAAEAREKDRERHMEEFEKIRQRDQERLEKFWQRHNETQKAIADLTAEVRAYRLVREK